MAMINWFFHVLHSDNRNWVFVPLHYSVYGWCFRGYILTWGPLPTYLDLIAISTNWFLNTERANPNISFQSVSWPIAELVSQVRRWRSKSVVPRPSKLLRLPARSDQSAESLQLNFLLLMPTYGRIVDYLWWPWTDYFSSVTYFRQNATLNIYIHSSEDPFFHLQVTSVLEALASN
jgi:hypothetical protein